MLKLSLAMDSWLKHKFTSDPLWRDSGCRVVFSGPDVPGEGEHKVMDYIRDAKRSDPHWKNGMHHVMYGLDADYGWQLGERWRLEGVLSIVRGERRDISDDLYRISPDRLTLGLVYDRTSWSVRLEGEGIRQQSNVSDTNSEQETSGYGLVNLSASWQATDDIQVSGGIDNLFDRDYQQHLAGYNRVMGSDVTVGDRLPGVGRNLYVRFYYHR